MKRDKFLEELRKRVLVLDGAYGTEFFKLGFNNCSGEELNLINPNIVYQLQKDYVRSGADIILTNTFNANPAKLQRMGLQNEFQQINVQAFKIAKRATKATNCLVFGNISSCGEYIEPIGKQDFTKAQESFYKQAKLLNSLGVDGFLVETISDLKELKAIIIGIRRATSCLPIIAQMTFDEFGRSLTGTDIKIFATLLNDLDVDVLGINCSTEPKQMLKNLKILAKYSNKPLSIEPNAGQPKLIKGKLQYMTEPEDFAIYIEDFISSGANIIGGCCGTDQRFIKLIKRFVKNRVPIVPKLYKKQTLSSRTISRNVDPFLIIGERINPASREKFQKEIKEKNFSTVLKEANSQKLEGATVLDVNLGIEKLLEEDHFSRVIKFLDKSSSLPLSMDIQSNEFLSIALREYCGRAIINSAKVTPLSLQRKAKLLKNYGGMLVLLAMDKKIPTSAKKAIDLVLDGINFLESKGISKDRVFVDPLLMSLGAGFDPKLTLKILKLLSVNGLKSIVGLSNLSFGLPQRSQINGTFLAQSYTFGLRAAIMNTKEKFAIDCIDGSLIIDGKKKREPQKTLLKNTLSNFILIGDKISAHKEIENLLKDTSPIDIIQNVLTKIMQDIGELYSKKKIYLPELLLASQTSTPIFEYLTKTSKEKIVSQGKILLATVEGDIHSIGKNIIATILKSGGFEIFDIGSDITPENILKQVKDIKPDIVGLSAMMTTTVGKVQNTVKLIKKSNLSCKIISGGASMNKNIAFEFGCDAYCKNASEVVSICKSLMK